MNTSSNNAVLMLLVSLAIVFILVFAAFYVFNDKSLSAERGSLKSLKNALSLRDALIQALNYLPVIIIFIYISAFSVLFTLSPFHTRTFMYKHVAVPSYILLCFFIMIVVLSEFVFIPKLYKERLHILYSHEAARKTLSHSEELYRKKQYEELLPVLEYYFEIDENNKRADEMYANALKQIPRRTYTVESEIELQQEFPVAESASYYERGRLEYDKGNYYTALFYLERAVSLHKDSREIRNLYETCKRRVDSLIGQLTKKEAETKSFIQDKEKALEHLRKKEYYQAYFIFVALGRKYPQLIDLKLYTETAEKELKKLDFTSKEAENLVWLPSMRNIVFIDRDGFINTVEKIIPYRGSFYFYNIVRYRDRKNKTQIFRSKYGKWLENRIRLKNEEGYRKISEKEKPFYYIDPFVEPGYLLYFNENEKLLSQLNIYERFSLSETLYKSGVNTDDKYVYLSKKLGVFFSVYVFSLFLSALAWAKRSIYEFPPVIKLFLFLVSVPLIAYFAHLFYVDMNQIFVYTHRYVTQYIFKGINIAIYTASINLLTALIATLYFLSQSSRVE